MNTEPTSIELAAGKTFEDAPVAAVQDFLRSRSTECLTLDTTHMKIITHGPRLILECVNGHVRQFPIRESCFDKLLRWHRFPSGPVRRMGSDTAAQLLNGVLRIINKPVRVRVEDGDALTVTSTEYAEITDDAVLERCHTDFGEASRVTRTDHFMRLNYDGRIKTEPVVGDICGLGVEIANSETGFMALQVAAHIYRYVCKNGAIAPFGGYSGSMVHYRVKPEALREHLDKGFDAAEGMFATITTRLADSTKTPTGDLRHIARRLDGILGPGRGKSLVERFYGQHPSGTRYDLFNFITHTAQSHQPWFRMRMETYAGELLMRDGSTSRADSRHEGTPDDLTLAELP